LIEDNHTRKPIRSSGDGALSFKVQGLDCAEEVAVLRGEVGPLVGGGENLAFDVLNGRMTVLESAPSIAPGEILAAVRRTGMTAVEWRGSQKGLAHADDRLAGDSFFPYIREWAGVAQCFAAIGTLVRVRQRRAASGGR